MVGGRGAGDGGAGDVSVSVSFLESGSGEGDDRSWWSAGREEVDPVDMMRKRVYGSYGEITCRGSRVSIWIRERKRDEDWKKKGPKGPI